MIQRRSVYEYTTYCRFIYHLAQFIS